MKPHALITGAAKRVGQHLALCLAKEGYDITLHYNSSRDEAQKLRDQLTTLGVSCHLRQGDLSQPEMVARVLGEALPTPVTTLIHNASCFEKDDLSNVSAQALLKHMQIHTFSAVQLTKDFMAQLPQGLPGHIICISDGMKRWSISPDFLSYSLSKQSLESFVTLIAPAIAPRARINAIAPGATLPGVVDTPDTFNKIKQCAPLQCVSSPQEVARAVLALEQLPSTTGQIIDLSGGMAYSNRDVASVSH